MKPLQTFFCCLFMALCGVSLAVIESSPSKSTYPSYKTVSAAPVLNWAPNVRYPLDLTLTEQNKSKVDSEERAPERAPDTVYVERIKYRYIKQKSSSTMAHAQAKRQGLSTPAVSPDTLVLKNVDVGREEYPTDTISAPKASITLTVDGEVVYKR